LTAIDNTDSLVEHGPPGPSKDAEEEKTIMAETAAKTTTPRRRPRAAAGAAKPASAAPKPRKPAAKKPADDVSFTYDLAPMGETRNYSLFDQGKDLSGSSTGMVGKLYAPLGTTAVQVTVTGPADAVEPEEDE
jgi:hypothetical protein